MNDEYILPATAAEQAPTETQVNIRRPGHGDLPLPFAIAGSNLTRR